MSFLEIDALTIVAGSNVILSEISLTVEKGQVMGLIGESGAGKSTLALAGLGFLRPGLTVKSGTIRMDVMDFVAASAAEMRAWRRSQVAYVAQSAAAAFNPFYRLESQVTELRQLQSPMTTPEKRALASDLFRRLQLPDPTSFGRKYPHQASGGQLQRAMIAMALLNKPKLIVFDEPTTALDVTTQVEVLRTIRQIVQEEGCAALYVSHDLSVVSQMCDNILVLKHGKMVEMNTARQIIDHPQTEYCKALVAHRAGGDFARLNRTKAPLLITRGLDLGYAGVKLVHDINVTVGRSEIVALVGESGSGKTTVARAIAGLLAPMAGVIALDGVTLASNVDARSDEQRKRIQFIHQLPDVALNPRHTIRATLARPLQKFHGLKGDALEARLLQLMADVELSPKLLDRYPGALSGGQKQRVCIARCLAADPQLLVCDEITSALDPLVEDSILRLLWKLKQEKDLSILFITHNLGVTRRFAHTVVIMERGQIVEHGPTEAVFAAPSEAYTKRLLAAEPTTAAGWLDTYLAATQ